MRPFFRGHILSTGSIIQQTVLGALLPLLVMTLFLTACSDDSESRSNPPAQQKTHPQDANAGEPDAKATKTSPAPTPALADRATALVRSGEKEKGLDLLRKALEASPDDLELHRSYQDLMRLAGKGRELRAAYASRLEKMPESAAAHYLFGRSIIIESPRQAEEAFRKSVKLDPKFQWSYLALGACQGQMGNFFDASQTFENALKEFPDSAFLHLNLADARFHMKAFRRALESVAEAEKLKPDLVEAIELEGLIRYEQGDIDGSLEALKKATEQKPDLGKAHIVLADIYAKKGDLDSAKQEVAKAKALGVEAPAALKAKLELP